MARCFFLSLVLLLAFSVNSQAQKANSLIFNLKTGEIFQPVFNNTSLEDSPTYLEVFLPEKAKANGRGLFIFPGGGYALVAYGHEGRSWAPFFNEQGMAVFVLRYTLPKGNRSRTFNDVVSAMNIVKTNATQWGVDLSQIGVIGFSAGGHLAATVATHFTEPIKPAFQILFYPVTTMEAAYTHAGSRENLLGKTPSQALVDEYSNEKQVSATTPPAIIIAAADDQVVPIENSLNYFKSLNEKKIPVSLHIYPIGNHGWGYSKQYKYHEAILKELSLWLQTTLKYKQQ
ncbi:alpha/beta hydrolase [Capnocytophaga sp. oral taxon 864]|uniref:alpha/beta hydrolase n=1 Tax=Capnocytophaga sp. oral taxon 864 TaxID=1316593 RepID=UPI000D036B02|nr:alpha/beta hydrolase [Capnocytophaga sp. oral taxon 864]AVM55608.1 xylanase [Capnocytophaga sp. oral taxon 864]